MGVEGVVWVWRVWCGVEGVVWVCGVDGCVGWMGVVNGWLGQWVLSY